MSSDSIVCCEGLCKSYRQGPQNLVVLNRIELLVVKGDKIAIVGTSGSGKSTLLNLLGGLDTPDAGRVLIGGQDMARISEAERGGLRNKRLGFVYQFHHLLTEFNALENVAIPLLIRGEKTAAAREQARAILTRVGLAERLSHKPGELSGGERQRVAIARALVTRPDCVLLDEPTGNLDRKTAEEIHQLLLDLNRELATSLVVVTHDQHLAQSMDRRYELVDGHLTQVN